MKNATSIIAAAVVAAFAVPFAASAQSGSGGSTAAGSPGVTGSAGTTFDHRRGPTSTLGANAPTTGTGSPTDTNRVAVPSSAATSTDASANPGTTVNSGTAASGATQAGGTTGTTTTTTGTTGTSDTTGSRYERGAAGVLGQQRTVDNRGWSPFPGTTNGYAGFGVGRTSWDSNCIAVFECDDNAWGGKIYAGGLFNRNFGLELGYIHMGNVDRSGGQDRAQGINLSLVGVLPLNPLNVYGKVGTTYGFTRTNASPASGLASGRDRGFGLSYGVGVGFEIGGNWELVADWERHRFEFVNGKDRISMLSIGARMRF